MFPHPTEPALVFLAFLASWPWSLFTLAYDGTSPVLCDAEMNLFCPPSTSCCPTFKSRMEPNVVVGYSCLMSWSTRFPQGPCCPHYDDDGDTSNAKTIVNSAGSTWKGGTGCADGYECTTSSSSSPPLDFNSPFLRGGSGRRNSHSDKDGALPYCRINSTAHPTDNAGNPINNIYETMPRYRACQSTGRDGVDVFGFPIPSSTALSYKNSSSTFVHNDSNELNYVGQLAYYSNMGQITADDRVEPNIMTAVIGVHGSGRDAGTYLCALTATVADASSNHIFTKDQRRSLLSSDVLVIAPWFIAPSDKIPPTSSIPYIQWDDLHPIAHTFRYGAESIPNVNNMTISSFGAIDALVERLCDRKRFPNLRRIVVIGHSAGGQFVHRWALSSNSWLFGNGQFAHRYAPGADLPNVRVIAANPRSFAYLDNRRYFAVSDQVFVEVDKTSPAENEGNLTPFDKYRLRPPSAAEESDCNKFNEYEWGLEPNEGVPAPYIIENIHKLIDHGDNTELFCRYASRDIVYISGQRDFEKNSLGSHSCRKHTDGYQGPSRRERSERFFASLQFRGREVEFCGRSVGGTSQVHDRQIVRDVGHDHALIFQSPECIQAMFGFA